MKRELRRAMQHTVALKYGEPLALQTQESKSNIKQNFQRVAPCVHGTESVQSLRDGLSISNQRTLKCGEHLRSR